MAFQAGAINAGGFLACGRFVTHTTGFATHFGAELAQGHYQSSLGMISVPLFFLTGAIISAFFIERNISANRNPKYTFVVFLIALILLMVTFGGHFGTFGVFGEPIELSQDYYLLALLSLASGLQNAAITSASGAVVRTTHLTGITTDLGIGLVRIFSRTTEPKLASAELKANFSRVGLIVSFILGSTISSYLFLRFDYLGFLLPALVSSSLVLLGLYLQVTQKRSSLKV